MGQRSFGVATPFLIRVHSRPFAVFSFASARSTCGARALASAAMSNSDPADLPPKSGDPSREPNEERSAEQDRVAADWAGIASSAEFKALLKAKARFIIPATLFFIVYYFALPVLVGYLPEMMKTRVGPANLAYLFALSQFFMAWVLAFIYTRVAAKWDAAAAALLAKFRRK